eukprot:8494152-Heterocapsa_arctica.AAC.1
MVRRPAPGRPMSDGRAEQDGIYYNTDKTHGSEGRGQGQGQGPADPDLPRSLQAVWPLGP